LNKEEAKQILAQRLERYRQLSYEQLKARRGEVETEETVGPSGAWYQLEFEVFWDGKPNGDIRVLGSIDDGGLRAFAPLCDSFAKNSGDGFVGE
jgi:hypothetical protein